MGINAGYVSEINTIYPSGTNSTMFTECCNCAITSGERVCPSCGNKVIGYNEDNERLREKIRWENATRNWRKK